MGKIFSEGFSFSGFERDKVYLSDRGRRFVDISGLTGLDSVTDGRGAAYADFDNDGDYDLFLTALQGQVHHLFKNNVGQEQSHIRVALTGDESGSDAYGAEVRVKTSQGIQTKIKSGGSGYVSQSDPRLLFGLGSDAQVEWLEVRWPSGLHHRFGPLAAGTSVHIREGTGELESVTETVFSMPDPAEDTAQSAHALRYGIGQPFPAVKMIDANGETTDFHAFREPGRSYLVNLWATYCVPCREEMPELQKLFPELQAAQIDLLGISLDMGKAKNKVPRFLNRMGVTYPIFTTDENIFSQLFSGEQMLIPLTFIVDRKGLISEVLTGWSPEAQTTIHRLIGAGD